jgi:hypothetical protein
MTGSSPVDRSKLGTKRHILTDKNGIPLSVVITSASTHDIKAVTDVIDNAVIQRPVIASLSTTKERKSKKNQHLCLDRAYNSKSIIMQISKRGYVPHILPRRKRGQKKKMMCQNKSLSQNSIRL